MASAQLIIILFSLAVASVTADVGTKANITKRSLLPFRLPHEVALGFAMKELGILECQGIDHVTGGNFFEKLLGGEGRDAGGNYLCLPTCGGVCIPNQDLGVAPLSLYPFGCKCAANRCDREGPMTTQLSNGVFKIVCMQDTRCTCDGMSGDGENFVYHTGYLCNWINLNSLKAVSYGSPIHPTYSPIRWCSCCPQQPHPVPGGGPPPMAY